MELATLTENRKLALQTQRNYMNRYVTLCRIANRHNDDLRMEGDVGLLDACQIAGKDNVESTLSYLNVAFLLLTGFDMPCDETDAERQRLFDVRNARNGTQREVDLPEHADIKKYIATLEGRAYIVNFLMFTYGCRNKDVNVFVTTRTDTKNINTQTNYLLVKAREIEWVRNDYKTAKQHGQQRIVIKAKKFIDAVRKLPLNTWLLSQTDKPIATSSLSNVVQRLLPMYKGKHLTERQLFKLNVQTAQRDEKSLRKLVKLGKSRGTALVTIAKHYDVA